MKEIHMKHIMHYDSSGRIESLIVVNGPPGMNAGLTPKPGLLAADVEGMKIGAGAPDVEAFRKLVKDQKVLSPVTRIALAKK
jgi:hypothetical protein